MSKTTSSMNPLLNQFFRHAQDFAERSSDSSISILSNDKTPNEFSIQHRGENTSAMMNVSIDNNNEMNVLVTSSNGKPKGAPNVALRFIKPMIETFCSYREGVRVNPKDITAIPSLSRWMGLERAPVVAVKKTEQVSRGLVEVDPVSAVKLGRLYNKVHREEIKARRATAGMSIA